MERYRWLRWPEDPLGVRAEIQVRNDGAGVEVVRRGSILSQMKELWRGFIGELVRSFEHKRGVKVFGLSR